MGKISLDIVADASTLLQGTGEGIVNLKELAAQGKVTKDSLKKDFADAGKSTQEFNSAINTTVKALADEGKVVEALILKYGNATNAQKALTKELANMAVAGQRNTKEFRELSKVAAELKDTIEDTRGEIKKLSSDTGVFDKIAEGGRAVAAGFSVAAGASALFGEENENLQKSIQKAQGAMTLLLGVQEIAKIATEKGGIATGIATAAQTAYATVVGTSTGALKLFRLALAATGIGAAIIGIALLVEHWEDLKNAISGTTKDQKTLNGLFKEAGESVEKERVSVGGLVEEYKNVNTSKERRIAIIKQLKEESPAYFGQLKEEKTSIYDLTTAYGKYAEALVIKSEIDLIAQKVAENNLKVNQESKKSVEETLTTFDNLKEGLGGVLFAQFGIGKGADYVGAAHKKQAANVAELNKENENLKSSLTDLIAKLNELGGDPSAKAQKAAKKIAEEFKRTEQAIKLTLEQEVGSIISGDALLDAAKNALKQFNIPVGLQIEILSKLGLSPQQIADSIVAGVDKSAKLLEDTFGKPIKVPNVEAPDVVDKDGKKTTFAQAFFGGQKGIDGKILSDAQLDAVDDAMKTVANSIQNNLNEAFNTVIETQQRFIDSLDKRIEKQKEVVANEQALAQKGAENNLALETDKLNKLNEAKDKALRKQKAIQTAQLAIDTATQLSALATAAAQVFAAYAPIIGGTAIAAALVGVMFAAFAAAKVTAAVAVSKSDGQGFRDGGYTGDGDPSEVSTALGKRSYKYHKKEFVANEEMTKEGRDFLEGWHKGDKQRMLFGLHELLENTGVSLPDPDLPAKLSLAKEVNEEYERSSSNRELVLMRKKLEDIEANMIDWKKQPKESSVAHGEKLITKKGNRTVITTKKKQ
jgi:hypothetical protein